MPLSLDALMRTSRSLVVGLGAIVAICAIAPQRADAKSPKPSKIRKETLRLDGGLTFTRFEQQVKTEIGGARGERLVEETQVGLGVVGTYRVWGPLSLGLYGRFDVGSRSAARFVRFDDDNAAVTEGEVGGAYQELWLGPLARVQWRTLFAEFGYGALGLRWDDARDDLTTASGDTDSALQTSNTVAWMAALGAGVPLTPELQAVLRVEYRVRYYDRRDGEALVNETVHGTQNFSPFFGVAWTP